MNISCNGCGKVDESFNGICWKYHEWVRHDAYGIYTGVYCNECYDSDQYPYKKNCYESELIAGKYLELEDY